MNASPGPCTSCSPAPAAEQRNNGGWGGISNGDLLRLAETQFGLFITSDQNMRYQQNLAQRRIAILMLTTNKWRALLAAQTAVLTAVDTISPGEFRTLSIPPAP